MCVAIGTLGKSGLRLRVESTFLLNNDTCSDPGEGSQD